MPQYLLEFPIEQNFQLLDHPELRPLETQTEHRTATPIEGRDLKIPLRQYDLHLEVGSVLPENQCLIFALSIIQNQNCWTPCSLPMKIS